MRILVYRLGSLGDTVVALPALHLVRRHYPDAEITILTNTPVSGKAAPLEHVLGNSDLYDDVLHYPVGLRKPGALLQLMRTIRERKFAVAIHLAAPRGMTKTMRDYAFFKACGISQVIGLPWKATLEKRSSPETHLYQHESERLVNRIRSLGRINLDDSQNWDLQLSDSEIEEADKWLKSKGVTSPFIALSVGTKVDAKDWGVTKWKQLVQRLGSTFPDLAVIAIGARDEQSRADDVLAGWNGIRANLCGLTSPRVSAALLRDARLFIGHDSGPMHLAAATGVPCIAIFSARNLPGQWYPWGKRHTVIYHQVPCAGCGLETCIVKAKMCIESIAVDEVLDAAKRHLEDVPGRLRVE